jgi:iron complex outermembrane receptor protein
LLSNRLTIDISGFYYRLNNAIVQRKDASGADYFTNAGSTKQKGIETSLSFELLSHPNKIIKNALIWGSHSYHHFRYDVFKQVANDFLWENNSRRAAPCGVRRV